MLKIIPTLLQLTEESFSEFERNIIEFMIDRILHSLEKGNSSYALKIIEENPINYNIQDYILELLRRSGLFIEFNSMNKGCILLTKALDNHFAQYPFVIFHNDANRVFLYMNRYFFYDVYTENIIKKLLSYPALEFESRDTEMIMGDSVNIAQKKAVLSSISNKFSIITGGPGVGKTTSIKMFLKVIANLHPEYKLNICTPTGKATNRIREVLSVQEDQKLQDFITESVIFSTMHALLGLYSGYKQLKSVKSDVIIIDEVSMMSLFLFYQLLQAIDDKHIKHIIFIGDVNQLPSIDVGNVFQKLIEHYPQIVSVLDINLRSNVSVIELSNQILAKDYINFLEVIGKFDNLVLQDLEMSALIKRLFSLAEPSYNNYLKFMTMLQEQEDISEADIEQLFNLYNDFIVLCLLNVGQYGVDNINDTVEQMILHFLGKSIVNNTRMNSYTGKPIIIARNHQKLGLYNGDIGIIVKHNSIYCAVFIDGDSYKFYPLEMLPQYNLAYAITVHKTQGSEFNNILLVIPEFKTQDKASVEIYNNQMLYTAVTRAKHGVTLCSRDEQVRYMIEHSYHRI